MGCWRWKGAVKHTSQSYYGGTAVVTANVTFEALSGGLPTGLSSNAPPPSPDTFIAYPDVSYQSVEGTVQWDATGTQGGCTISGHASFPVAAGPLSQFQTYNNVVDGSFHRAVIAVLGSSQTVTETLACPGKAPLTTTAPLGAWLDLGSLTGTSFTVTPDGGTAKGSRSDGSEKWSWCFVALQEGQDLTCTPE